MEVALEKELLMENKSLLNESFYADPWTPETPSEDGADLWQARVHNETATKENKKFDNDFTPQKKPFPVHLLPCPETLPPLDLNKGLRRMENKLKRIQKSKVSGKLSSQDILSPLNSSRDNTEPTLIDSQPTLTVSMPRASHPPPARSSLFCCRYRPARDPVVASYTWELAERDTIPLVLGDELLEND